MADFRKFDALTSYIPLFLSILSILVALGIEVEWFILMVGGLLVLVKLNGSFVVV